MSRVCRDPECERIVDRDWCRDHGPHWWEKVKAPPKPKIHERHVDRLHDLTAVLLDDHGNDDAYRWAYSASHGERCGEQVGGGSGPSDPTATIVTARQGMVRAHLRRYDDAVLEAVDALERAVFERGKAGDDTNPRTGVDFDEGEGWVTQAEHAELVRAQQRRHQRGVGYGAS